MTLELSWIDWAIIGAFFIFSIAIGLAVAKDAGKSAEDFFLSGRNMPWWLLGVSMVATTFSADTPNLVTNIVRENGVAGNWVWWAFLLTGMLTVFIYAKLWRRSKVITDLEFYELRYSGKEAAFIRGFRAIYLGVFFNVMIMASVSLAAIKIGGVMLNLSPVQTLLIASIVTVIYSSLGGLKGVLYTDFFQFIIAMIGSIGAAIVALNLPQINGLDNLLAQPNLQNKLNFIPDFSDTKNLIMLFIIPLAVQWWSVWYPGAEPGGGGYIAQRMLSAKNEKHAIGATLFFNAAHYALRPWPWIIVAFCSMIVFPDLASLKEKFPHIPDDKIGNDLAYPAMLTYLPVGLMGLVVASLISAFMSTISTQLNWGSSYITNDFYLRFINPHASQKQLVNIGRISTIVLMALAALLALSLESALKTFDILLQIGAGTGLIFILRWFWWRINAWSEITAMVVSFLIALYFHFIHEKVLGFSPLESHWQLCIGVLITTLAWVSVALATRPTDMKTLISFYKLTRPGGVGWKAVVDQAEAEGTPIKSAEEDSRGIAKELLCVFLGSITIYSALFATGSWIYGNTVPAIGLSLLALLCGYFIFKVWGKLNTRQS
ncbi:sodium:solute symporter family protein [Thermoflexibacter ruber]|uniref:Na+/proline symporter n=1 Tax=Thermoflexibacter ruber TaxID=1003 RepID=A0A1I2H079_9BACT|nr:sodium:solute symporter family protein [Thermoflexibacter ruber]SFF22938.1 Na+/proline symporter [Thermoflexibacter ruber]